MEIVYNLSMPQNFVWRLVLSSLDELVVDYPFTTIYASIRLLLFHIV